MLTIDDGLLFLPEGIKVFVRIQDGAEYIGSYKTEPEATQEYLKGQRILNGVVDREPHKYRIVSKIVEQVERF